MENNKNILLINGSIRGELGNAGAIVQQAASYLKQKHNVSSSILTLSQLKSSIAGVYDLLNSSSGFFVTTGTYWNSWGSPLQRFLEVMTAFENAPALFGKPVSCAITMDSVGGTDVAARLHFAFAGLGCWSPPCSTIVLSRTGQEAIAASVGKEDDPNEDVWRLSDLEVVLDNLVTATQIKPDWKCWPHGKLSMPEGKWPDTGDLDMDSPKFL
ncbi:MAG: NAD(P)H-dependent oxidoreductase [Niastella sp.]|nr:NAD(P)H-dependent oxidoreductase [Niastella sp.]